MRFLSSASFWKPDYVCPSAWIEHAPFAFWICDALRPRRFVELGTHHGYSYFAFCQAIDRLALGTSAFAVDTWQGDEHAGFFDENVFQAVAEKNTKKYAAFSHLIRSTFDDALQKFEDQSVDLLHIDGRHFYCDVKHDFETWRSKLTDNAIVLFHDTSVRERGFGVCQLFDELSATHPTFQFFHCYGLGVLAIGEAPGVLTPLFESSGEDAEQIRTAYAALGGALSRGLQDMRLAEQDARLAEQSSQLNEKDARLAEQSSQLNEKDARLAEQSSQLNEKDARLAEQGAQIAEYLYHLNRYNAWGWVRLGLFLDKLIRVPFRLFARQRSTVNVDERRDLTASKHADQISVAAKWETGPSKGVNELGPESARSIDIDHSLAVPFNYVVKPRAAPGRLAAILHIFYEDLAVELRSYLRNIPGEVDVFIATADADRKLVIERAFASWASGRVEVRVMPNRGRDIAPRLNGFRDVYDRYDFVLHLHGKRSDYAPAWANWRHYLLETLVGSPLTISSIVEAFERNSRLGMVAAQHFEPVRHCIHWGYNLDHARHLAARMGFSIDPGAVLDFPSGSMFWARSAALRPLLDLELTNEEFEPEDGQQDGTLAHAVERIYFHVCERAGFDWIKIARPELMADTPAVVEVRDENELDRFFQRHVFRLHDPQGVLPRLAPPTPLEKPAPALLDAVRQHVLAMGKGVDFSRRTRASGFALKICPAANSCAPVAAAKCVPKGWRNMTNVINKLIMKLKGMRRSAEAVQFDEEFYLDYYADARQGIERGDFKSAEEHYRRHGIKEGRATHYDTWQLLKGKFGEGVEPAGMHRWGSLEAKIKPVQGRLCPDRRPTTNVFIPTIDPDIFFGGYIAFFHFLCRLAEAGTRLRFVVLEDHCDLRWFLKGIAGRERWVKAFEKAEFKNMTIREQPLDIHEEDAVIVYSTWMALMARDIVPMLKSGRAVFFVQEFEPVFHEYGSIWFLVNSAYRLPHVPIFNTRALHDYFKKHRIGAFANSDEDQLSFEHNIGALQPTRSERPFGKRLLFYARPEVHAARNLFEIGILALRAAVRAGIIDDSWEVVGIGSLVHQYHVALDEAQKFIIPILPRVPEHEYESFISRFDVGLSLMSSPHPGVVHFEWAVQGIATVVNCTPERDRSFFDSYDLPIVPCDPDIDGIVRALAKAIELARRGYMPRGDASRSFARSWDEAFSPQFIAETISVCAIPI